MAMKGMFGTVGSFLLGVFIRIVPTEIPELITWSLQNLAFIATIAVAYFTIKKLKREKIPENPDKENVEEAQRIHAFTDQSDSVGSDRSHNQTI